MAKQIFLIDGGLGRVIASTGAIPKKSIILTSYPSVFLGNPNVKEVYGLNTPYLVENIVHDKDLKNIDPYLDSRFYRGKKNLSFMFNVLLNKKEAFAKPVLFLDEQADLRVKEFLEGSRMGDYVLFQPFGGEYGKDLVFRGMPVEFAQKIADLFKNKKVNVLYVRGKDHPELKNVVELNQEDVGIPELFCFVARANKIIAIDSCVQHMCAGLNKKALVFWTGTDEKNFGYKSNINVRVGPFFKYIFRIPLNNPNRLKKNPYVWKNELLKDVLKYCEGKQ